MPNHIIEKQEHAGGIEKQVEDKDIDRGTGDPYRDLDALIVQYSKKPGQLIGLLHQAQEIFGYLPVEVQQYIADKTGISISVVNGVVTFYSLFSSEPKGEYSLKVCLGTACYVKGAQEIMENLKETLKIGEGESTPDRLFTLESTRCIGSCGIAPVLLVNKDVFGEIEANAVPKLINKYRKGEQLDN